MTDEDANKIRGVVKEEINAAIEPVKKILKGHTRILEDHSRILETHSQILEAHSQILENHTKVLDNHTKKLNTLWDQTVKLTEDIEQVKEVQDSHTISLKQIVKNTESNKDDAMKLDARVQELENQAGIIPPPELTLA